MAFILHFFLNKGKIVYNGERKLYFFLQISNNLMQESHWINE